MSIENYFDTTAIYERYTATIDEIGQEVKTWSVSTYVIGAWQGRSGNRGIYTDQEKEIKTERFYCSMVNILSTGRLAFSTSAFTFLGNTTSSTSLSSTVTGAMYFVSGAFSTYVVGNYLRYNGTTYVKNDMNYRDVLYVNDRLRNHHLQIDLIVDNEYRT